MMSIFIFICIGLIQITSFLFFVFVFIGFRYNAWLDDITWNPKKPEGLSFAELLKNA